MDQDYFLCMGPLGSMGFIHDTVFRNSSSSNIFLCPCGDVQRGWPLAVLLDSHDKLIQMLRLVIMAMSWGREGEHGLNKFWIRLQTGLSIWFLHCISDLCADLHPSSCKDYLQVFKDTCVEALYF